MTPHPVSDPFAPQFDWPLAFEAERTLREFIGAFLSRNPFARRLSARMRDETGTDFYEWVDHMTLAPEHSAGLAAVGLEEERVDAPAGTRVFHHPRAMMPRVLVREGGSAGGVPGVVALRPESLADFIGRHGIDAEIRGEFGSGFRRAMIVPDGGGGLEAVERLGCRSFVTRDRGPGFAARVVRARELWRMRRRDFADDAEGIAHALAIQERAVECVGADAACELFFSEERAYWEFRNAAARIQKRRQDGLGLGWANHDHHTFRCSRALFADVIGFFGRLGFQRRERYYAGAEAGWGAQIMEQPVTGIVVFADVDLLPGEVAVDFTTQRLPGAGRLGTVGLWCALHGDSFLQAGMHHLEARFDFPRLRDQLAGEGIGTMKPFSDFPFLRQAFTEGQRWPVDRSRAERILREGLISREQFDAFVNSGAIGSHLENLQRKGGYKGFNQKSVSAIIAATDPRRMLDPVHA